MDNIVVEMLPGLESENRTDDDICSVETPSDEMKEVMHG